MLPSLEMIQHCAPQVAPSTIAAIIQVESRGNPFALGINGTLKRLPRPSNIAETARQARYYISMGVSVDLGLMQINSHNLPRLGYTIEQVLEPCNNLNAGSQILAENYSKAAKRYGSGQTALKVALSAYNTGNDSLGFKNGYVAKYYPKYRIRVRLTTNPPQILANGKVKQQTKPISSPKESKKEPENPFTADSTVYQLSHEP
jgi:type IV secretion system protein VirB1